MDFRFTNTLQVRIGIHESDSDAAGWMGTNHPPNTF
jgi:hypothetical protein